LEFRELGQTSLRDKLLASGFLDVEYLTDDVPAIGILFDGDVSQPFLARKQPYAADRWFRSELVRAWRYSDRKVNDLQHQIKLLQDQLDAADQSKWMQLGKVLGKGPKLR